MLVDEKFNIQLKKKVWTSEMVFVIEHYCSDAASRHYVRDGSVRIQDILVSFLDNERK